MIAARCYALAGCNIRLFVEAVKDTVIVTMECE